MATAEQIKHLIQSHYDANQERFATLALQVAAHEARAGHGALATEIREIVDKSRESSSKVIPFRHELGDLLSVTNPDYRLLELVVNKTLSGRLERIIREYRQQDKIKKHGLANRRKLLLAGPPGTGKTMTALILAGELHLPLFTIMMDRVVTKFMGETSAKLRQVFDLIAKHRGVYLFDEFDAIGGERGLENDVGEMRRVLNSFLHFIERDNSDGLIVAATNNLRLLDRALFRRFDDVLHYELPSKDEVVRLIENRLGMFKPKRFSAKAIAEEAGRLSHAEISQAVYDAIKEAVLSDENTVSPHLLSSMLRDRRLACGAQEE